VNNTDADINDDWFWSFAEGGNGQTRSLDGDAWTPSEIHMGFQLTDDFLAVPEP
jgi:hypothetical protein